MAGGNDEESDEEAGEGLDAEDEMGADPLAEKVTAKLNTGKKLTPEEMEQLAFNDDDDEDDDSDGDLPGSEMTNGSALEAVDELLFLR